VRSQSRCKVVRHDPGEIEEKLLLFFIFLYVSLLGVLLMAGVYWICR